MKRLLLVLLLIACTDSNIETPKTTPDSNVFIDVDGGQTDGGKRSDGGHFSEDAGNTQVDAEMPLACNGEDCGPNGYCDEEQNACRCQEGYEGTPPDECLPIQTPEGWIGSPCQTALDCDFADSICHTDSDFIDGHCTLACQRYCPDREDYPVTFCIETSVNQDGHCYSRCDTNIYSQNGGCRSGYQCAPWPRYNEPEIVRSVCVPASWLNQMPCADSLNHAGNDECYLQLISDSDPDLRRLSLDLLEGRGTSTSAEAWLDLNFNRSQIFITNDLGRTINDNFTTGHRSSSPMRGAIVHYTASAREDGTIRYFVSSNPHASTHFVIGSERNGLIVQIFSHRNRTWHAGSNYNHDRFGIDFANAGYLNPRSSGGYEDYAGREYDLNLPLHGASPIQVEGGIPNEDAKYARKEHWQPYTYYQLLSFVLIGRALHEVYTLDPSAIERHGDVAASRVDPGPQLPLSHLKNLVFNHEDVFQVDWLAQFKLEANWISNHPEAR